jgi:hypothetical protein
MSRCSFSGLASSVAAFAFSAGSFVEKNWIAASFVATFVPAVTTAVIAHKKYPNSNLSLNVIVGAAFVCSTVVTGVGVGLYYGCRKLMGIKTDSVTPKTTEESSNETTDTTTTNN